MAAGAAMKSGLAAANYYENVDNFLRACFPAEPVDKLLPWRKRERELGLCVSDGEETSVAAAKKSAPDRAADVPAAGPTETPSASSTAGPSASTAIVPLPDKSKNGWVSRHSSKWECQKVVRQAPEANLFVADELDRLGELYKSTGGSTENTWRTFTYSKCAKKLRALQFELTLETVPRLRSIAGFGDKTVGKIEEILRTGSCGRTERLESSDRIQAFKALCKVHGVGSTIAAEWYARGITTVDEAIAAGLMNAQQRVGAKYWRDLEQKIPREEVSEIIDFVKAAMRTVLVKEGVPAERFEHVAVATAAGSYRRGKPCSGDVDVLMCRRDGGKSDQLINGVLEALAAAGCLLDHLTHEDEMHSGGVRGQQPISQCKSYRGIIKLPTREVHRRLDLKVYPEHEYGYALLYFTGSAHFNRSMRHYAKAKGYSLSDHGLVHAVKVGANNVVRGTENLVPAATEEEIFAALGLEYIAPTDRNTDVTPHSDAPPMLENHSRGAGNVVEYKTDRLDHDSDSD